MRGGQGCGTAEPRFAQDCPTSRGPVGPGRVANSVCVGGWRERGGQPATSLPPVSASGPWEGHVEQDILGTGMGAPGQPTFKVGRLDHL